MQKKNLINPSFSTEDGISEVPMEGKWVQLHCIEDINGLSHGVGKCPPQQGACKLTLNIKSGVIEEALIETVGCSGITQSAVMASEILIGKNLIEALNCHLVCNAIDDALKNIFLQLVYGRTQTAFTDCGLGIGCTFDELSKGGRSFIGTVIAGHDFGPRPLETAEGRILELGLDNERRIIGYKYLNLAALLADCDNGDMIQVSKYIKYYGRYENATYFVNPRKR